MTGYTPYNSLNSYQGTQYFPQPQGNVYLLNNSLEAANVPMGAGLSVAICPSEGLLCLKTLQGGAPSILFYSIAPYEQKIQCPSSDYGVQIESLKKEIEALAKQIAGGDNNEST